MTKSDEIAVKWRPPGWRIEFQNVPGSVIPGFSCDWNDDQLVATAETIGELLDFCELTINLLRVDAPGDIQ
jgi:hypothetical protein